MHVQDPFVNILSTLQHESSIHHIVLAILYHVIPAIPFSRAGHPESDERVWIFSPEVRLELFHPTFQGRYFTHLTIEIASRI